MRLFEKEALEGPTKIYTAKPTKHYLIASCTFKYKRTCGVTRCSLARCCGCIWSRISKKRISKPIMKKLKDRAEMHYTCESKPKYEPKFSTQYHLKPVLTCELKPEPLKPLPYVHPLEKGGN